VGAITRGIKLYNVWAGDGDPVASVEFGVTVEDWGGRLVAVMTIDETSNKFGKPWDSGFSSRSDMRSHPVMVSGSGGTITLLDNGWYKNFLSGGYSIAGSRVERTWDENGETVFSQGYADKVKSGLGVLNFRLLDITTQMDSDIVKGDDPLIVGVWTNAVIKKTNSGGKEELIEGIGDVVFKAAAASVTVEEDEAGAPLTYSMLMSPSIVDFGTSLVFPENSFCRIASGHNKGSILKVDAGSYPYLTFDDGGILKGFFVVTLKNDYGVFIDDINELGLVTDLSDAESITEMSTYEFFTQKQEFNVSESSIVESPIIVNGVPVSNFTTEDGAITVEQQFLSNPIVNLNFVNNNNYDMTGYMVPSEIDASITYTRNENSYYISGTTQISLENADSVSNRSVDGQRNKSDLLDQQIQYLGAVGLSYYVENIPRYAKGICVDMYIETIAPSPVEVVVNTSIVVVGVWDGSGEWLSQEHTEVLYQESIISTHNADEATRRTYIKNFGADYFTPIIPDVQMEQFDNKVESSDAYGDKYIRGRTFFSFQEQNILNASPDRLYILINGASSKPIGIKPDSIEVGIREIGFFGQPSSSSADTIDSITASVTGEDWQTLDVAIDNIAQKQDWNSYENIVVNVPELPYYVRSFITKASELKTKNALSRILREAWCVGYMNRVGEYTVVSVAGKMGDDEPVADTHNFVLPHGHTLESDLDQYNSDDLVTGGTVSYDRDSTGVFRKSISITNADKDTFDASYATGFPDLGTAEILWNKCHLIWRKTGVLTNVRRDLTELWWLYQDSDAIRYFTNIVEWNGGSDFARDVITVDIGVTKIDTDTSVLPWNIGDPCRLMIPVKMNAAYSGVVEGVKYGSDYSAVVTIRVAEMIASVDRIIETRSSDTDKITETRLGTTDKITELGIV